MFKKQNAIESHKDHRKRNITAVLVVLAITLICGGVYASTKDSPEAVAIKKAHSNNISSRFAFDASKAPEWRQGPSNTTSMALFTKNHTCFTSIEFKNGNLNTDQGLQKTQDNLIKGGYTSVASGVIPLNLLTYDGLKQYDLHQYKVSGKSSQQQLYAGQEFGYIKMSRGYLYVQGYCNTFDQLSSSIPALESLNFNANIEK